MLCVLLTFIGTYKIKNDISYEKVVVTEGDTLWSFSTQYEKQIPADKWIAETIKLNDLASADIKVGEELRLPKGTKLNNGINGTEIASEGQ